MLNGCSTLRRLHRSAGVDAARTIKPDPALGQESLPEGAAANRTQQAVRLRTSWSANVHAPVSMLIEYVMLRFWQADWPPFALRFT